MNLTASQVAARLGYNVKYFQNTWRNIKGLPAPHQHELVGGGKSRPRWDSAQIDAFAGKSLKAA